MTNLGQHDKNGAAIRKQQNYMVIDNFDEVIYDNPFTNNWRFTLSDSEIT